MTHRLFTAGLCLEKKNILIICLIFLMSLHIYVSFSRTYNTYLTVDGLVVCFVMAD